MNGHLNREHAADLMERNGLDALILCEPEAFQYASGATIGPAGLFRRAGAGFVVVPRSCELPIGIVIADFNATPTMLTATNAEVLTHPIWIEKTGLASGDGMPLARRIAAGLSSIERSPEFTRPATFDLTLSMQQLTILLGRFGLAHGRLGLDLDFIPAADFVQIQSMLPDCSVLNGSPVLDRLRARKSPAEIALLARGILLSEAGMFCLQYGAVSGMRQADLIALYRQGVAERAADQYNLVTTAEYLTLGSRAKGPELPILVGDPVKADMICSVDGYASDMSRNFVLGEPTAHQLELHAIAERAFEAGVAELRPGRTLGDVYAAAAKALHDEGLGSYKRGHFGHGVGFSVFSEQWPFISANCNVEIESDMVLAYEIPLNVDGLASYNLEDQFLITSNGPISMNRLPRTLGSMPGRGKPPETA